ncbi:MAG: transglycosylase family protein [Actinomycetota bacterium]|nr:transglycosylase family protein [Actinomycetota bacterium]MDQ3573363.1 transglycosylase family protein [Actinomycetota bacterium]
MEEKRAEAERLQAQLDAQAERIASLDRQFDAARSRADEMDAAVARARALLAESDRRMAETNARLTAVSVESYVQGSSVSFLEQLSSTDGNDLSIRNQYYKTTAAGQRDALDELKAAREDLALNRARLEQAQQSARSAASSVEEQLRALAGAESSQLSNLARVNGELERLLREEQARRSALALREAEAAATQRSAVRLRGTTAGSVAPALPGHTAPGGMWTCIRQRESSGNYRAGGGGAYQFRQSTWESVGGTGRPEDADPATQDAKAIQLQQRSGWSQWTTARACGAY